MKCCIAKWMFSLAPSCCLPDRFQTGCQNPPFVTAGAGLSTGRERSLQQRNTDKKPLLCCVEVTAQDDDTELYGSWVQRIGACCRYGHEKGEGEGVLGAGGIVGVGGVGGSCLSWRNCWGWGVWGEILGLRKDWRWPHRDHNPITEGNTFRGEKDELDCGR